MVFFVPKLSYSVCEDRGDFLRESSYCFQQHVLAIAILSVCHMGGLVKNSAS